MRRRAGACSRCRSIPINASSGAGARAIRRNSATCRDDALKAAWYDAEQNLRNQIDRTYDAEMDFTLDELKTPGPGKGVAAPPDVDVRGYLGACRRHRGQTASSR